MNDPKTVFSKQKEQCLGAADLSRKGSVDTAIVDLVNLVNQQSHYFTTSSCSGRICIHEQVISGDGVCETETKIKGKNLMRNTTLEINSALKEMKWKHADIFSKSDIGFRALPCYLVTCEQPYQPITHGCIPAPGEWV